MSDELKEYREHLIKADQKSQEDFDKTLITVATSSLGVSMIFVRDFVGEGGVVNPRLILLGWGLLAASVGCVLCGFYLSRFALRKAINQIDENSIYTEKAGGRLSGVVEGLNCISGLLLLFGFVAVISFAYVNLHLVTPKGESKMANEKPVPGEDRGYRPPPPPPPEPDPGKKADSGYIPPPPPPKK